MKDSPSTVVSFADTHSKRLKLSLECRDIWAAKDQKDHETGDLVHHGRSEFIIQKSEKPILHVGLSLGR